jgi:tetratricopeptide (TPR) repeat protein
MISSEEAEDWWSEHGALYAFDPGILQELLYGRYARSPYERRRRHRAVAEALEALIAHDDPPPRHALLEIARHYEEARMPLKAAARLVRVAESTFAEGADRETAAHAAHAVELLHGAPKEELTPPESQKLLARAIILLLLGGEPSWRADTDADGARFVELAEEAQRAADAAGDPKLGANARYAAALVATAYQGLDKTVAAYRDALERARAAADPVAEFAILVSLGHQLDSVDLREGRDVLRQAHELLESGALAAALDEAHLAAEEARLEMSIGVAEFDLGNYGEALDRLGHSSQRLRQVRKRDDVAWSLSFLGQVYIAIGLYEAAEATLGEACALFADESAALGIRGYLKGLLGHLYVEWDRLDDARGQLVSARDETRASGFRAVIPLVEGYSAELLLAEGTPESLRAVEEALGSLESFGWARSEIAAASLRARAALAAGKVDDARELSTRAVDELERRGGFVPAVRSEEILFAHARILSAAGAPDAAQWLEQAKRVVGAKADSLTDPAQRTSFVERVRLSREILAA